ncbi:hypothetical protein FDA94_09010 [Herbidospora galbida]|uniref:Band 7 domain-containing protein n=1 Tax=Herbidospora galbida TaxID=2575442 RepID=A0A4U3ML77_9ACTN|nr:hypothetical protein [Herbidospora galbida]TKK89519.1 hypothetical protein FDA94_09010 [Herbidospora galbida]
MTEHTYPVVDEKVLGPASTRWLRTRSRRAGDIPERRSSDALVYRSRGHYHVDLGNLGLTDGIVVNATHVSVVDLSRNRLVSVDLAVPTADSREFQLVVTFACTVFDPVEVIESGQRNAAVALAGYLRGHTRIFELGLRHLLDEVNGFRLDVVAQIQAYVHHVSPRLPGISVTFMSVEVRTPADLTQLSTALFEGRKEHEIAAAAQKHGTELETDRVRGRQAVDILHADFQRQLAKQEEKSRQELVESKAQFARKEAELDHDTIGGDPTRALGRALQAGEITTKDFAVRLQALQDEERARADAREQREREDRIRREADERDRASKEFEARRELYREMIAQGYFDENDPGLTKMISELVLGDRRRPPLDSAGKPALQSSAVTEDMREEDDD